jgi:hypothetical protein
MIEAKMAKKRVQNADQRAFGTEPVVIKDSMDFIHALNWYNYYYDIKTAKKFLTSYCKQRKIDLSEVREINQTMCSIARMIDMGLDVPEESLDYLNRKLSDKKNIEPEENPENVISIRQYSDKGDRVIAELESRVDEVMRSDFTYQDPMAYELVKGQELGPKDAMYVRDFYLEIVQDLKDRADLWYRGKKKYNAYLKFMEKIVEDINTYLDNRKVAKPRKPRKKRAADPNKTVQNVKFLREYPELKLVSTPPAQIVGSSEVWLFNTKYRKLVHIVAKDGMILTIKGTTIQNIDEERSTEKTLRKPEETLPLLMKATKAKRSKVYNEIKTKAQSTTGRINANMLILGVK